MFNFKKEILKILSEATPAPAAPAPAAPAPAAPAPVTNTSALQSIENNNSFKILKSNWEKSFNLNYNTGTLYNSLNATILSNGYKTPAIIKKNKDYLPFIDAFIQTKIALNKKFSTLDELLNQISSDLSVLESLLNDVNKRIVNISDILDYSPLNSDLAAVLAKENSDIDKVSTTAIETLNEFSIQGALIKIVEKRASTKMNFLGKTIGFDKTVTGPALFQFANITGYDDISAITKILQSPKNIVTGWMNKTQNKNFSELVEDLTARELFKIGILAKDFYISLLEKQLPQNVNTSLNLFDILVGQVLNEAPLQTAAQIAMARASTPAPAAPAPAAPAPAAPAPAAPAPAAPTVPSTTTPVTQDVIDEAKQKIGKTSPGQVPDYVKFINEGKSDYLPDEYKIKDIKVIKPEGEKLYNAIKEIAYFINKKKESKLGQRLQQLGQAGQAGKAFAGVT